MNNNPYNVPYVTFWIHRTTLDMVHLQLPIVMLGTIMILTGSQTLMVLATILTQTNQATSTTNLAQLKIAVLV